MKSAAVTKEDVRSHWEAEVCGSRYGQSETDRKAYFAEIDHHRYKQEYMLRDFANFEASRGQRVLEVGLGTGADLASWARAGAIVHGRDLTDASVELVRERLSLEGLAADVKRGDAESLDFPDDFFDTYYSWGVLMCTPDPFAAFKEAHRVLKPGGSFKIMLYNAHSITSAMIWLLYGPLRGDFRGPRALYPERVESPGTKIYSAREIRPMIAEVFNDRPVEIHTFLGAGDLMWQRFSPRYRARYWEVLRAVYPRWIVRHLIGDRFGTVMTIHTVK